MVKNKPQLMCMYVRVGGGCVTQIVENKLQLVKKKVHTSLIVKNRSVAGGKVHCRWLKIKQQLVRDKSTYIKMVEKQTIASRKRGGEKGLRIAGR